MYDCMTEPKSKARPLKRYNKPHACKGMQSTHRHIEGVSDAPAPAHTHAHADDIEENY